MLAAASCNGTTPKVSVLRGKAGPIVCAAGTGVKRMLSISSTPPLAAYWSLVATPKSKASENRFGCNAVVNVKEDGSGDANCLFNTTGEYKQDFLHYIFDQKKDDQKKFLIDDIGFLQPDEFEISYDKADKQAPIKLQMVKSQ